MTRQAVDYFCDSLNSVGAGLVTSYTMGGFIHIPLVIAIVVVLVRVNRGRKPM
jgi:hypothetical protein